MPAEMVFDRQESGECTSRVVFPEVRVSAALPAYERTTVRLTPREAGSFGFACGMNMIHGRLIVEPAAAAGEDRRDGDEEPLELGTSERAAAEADAAEAAERRAEIADLTRRVVVGAVLTAPVLFAAMADSLLNAGWVPDWLLNHWLQLVLITPVMFYTGWPIHRIGWLTLRHRAADMNSLITLGTSAAYGYSPPSSDTVNSRGHSGMCDSCTCSTEAKTTTDITIDTSAPTAVDTYTVVGMTCGHCVSSVSGEVGKISGVTSVDVDLASGAVKVASDAPIDRELVRAAVEEAGYELAAR